MQAHLTKSFIKPSLVLLGLVCSQAAFALEFRSVSAPKAILFDAPSAEATKVFIVPQGYPLEVIVNLGDWVKVRDQQGSLNWIESKSLASKRMVLVTAKTEIKVAEDAASGLVATVEKDVVLELVSPLIKNGWVKVKHRDGISGYIQAAVLWGVN